MSKLTIIGVIVLMSISLLGVVGLQLYWISDAVRVKQEQFDRSVHEALAKVVEKLETQEALSAVANGMATLQQPAVHQHEPEAIPAGDRLPDEPQPAIPPAPGMAEAVKKQETIRLATTAIAGSSPNLSARVSAARPIRGDNYLHISYAAGDTTIRTRLLPEATGNFTLVSPAQADQLNKLQSTSRKDTLRAFRLSTSSSLRVERTSDSIRTFTRQASGKTFRISVDTLQYIALHLDSLWRHNRPNIIVNPEDIAAINVFRDSLIILHQAGLARYQAQRAASSTLYGNAQLSRGSYPATKMLTEAPATARLIVREKQPPVQPFSETQPGGRQVVKRQQIAPALPVAPAHPDPAKVEAKKEKLNDVVEKMVVEYVSKDVPLQERLNLDNLKPLLQNELINRGISLDFGYWVLSGQQDTVAAGHLKARNAEDIATYRANLFPNDIFDKPDYLAVYFTDSQVYALRSLWVMLLFSAIFTLVIVATFGTTIHIIFRQKKLSEMKNDFINNMTHEFKTPIATISLAADSIANPKIYSNPEKIQYYTNIIRQENKRMNVQVENVLQIAQLEKNDYRMNLQPTDLHILAEKAVESIRLQVEERCGQVSTHLNALEHELRLDEVHIYNVICNLLDNANKYSPATPDIRLETQSVEGGVLLAVEDKGMGMTRDTQLRVFDKFYRVPTGNLHNVKGFGLGLSYVKAIVKAHQGTVRLQSEPGKGSRFEIFLPFPT